ncbi:MAG: divalent-cation tolerance protein CutA [Gemmatimonadetes bacterium]|nr:divalent-cation tolerance protein CutA [Gemmatimonadota bacterium]
MPSEVRTVLATAPDDATARALADALVREGLAACVSLVPGVVSVYRWQGEVRHDAEVLMVMKTSAARVVALRERLVTLHPYDVPEVLSLSVEDGHPPYLAWVREETGGEP